MVHEKSGKKTTFYVYLRLEDDDDADHDDDDDAPVSNEAK